MSNEVIPDLPTSPGRSWDSMGIEEYVRLGVQSGIRDLSVTMDAEKVVIRGRSSDHSGLHAMKSAEAWLKEHRMQREIVDLINKEEGQGH
ncbi:MAG: hypothetical protein PHO54_01330 [Candidatus Peribacteraceae bacterium]|nr:hypothetical protein [Candidatus Peribacteraceae bacterium]